MEQTIEDLYLAKGKLVTNIELLNNQLNAVNTGINEKLTAAAKQAQEGAAKKAKTEEEKKDE